jgi:hypothetical protein
VDVENPKLAVARVPKAVNYSDRYGHPRSGASSDDLIAERELGLAFENIEGIDVVSVGVWVNAESGPKRASITSSSGSSARTRWQRGPRGIFSPSSGPMRMLVIGEVSQGAARRRAIVNLAR